MGTLRSAVSLIKVLGDRLRPSRMEGSDGSASGGGMESMRPGDGAHGVDYEFVELDKGSLDSWEETKSGSSNEMSERLTES
jgi:hypothetical protein